MNNRMNLHISWTYTPTDYFEAPLSISVAQGELTLEGRVSRV